MKLKLLLLWFVLILNLTEAGYKFNNNKQFVIFWMTRFEYTQGGNIFILNFFILTQKLHNGKINFNDLNMLGSLLSGLSMEQINKIIPDDVVEHLVQLSNTPSKEKLDLLLRKIKTSFKQRYFLKCILFSMVIVLYKSIILLLSMQDVQLAAKV